MTCERCDNYKDFKIGRDGDRYRVECKKCGLIKLYIAFPDNIFSNDLIENKVISDLERRITNLEKDVKYNRRTEAELEEFSRHLKSIADDYEECMKDIISDEKDHTGSWSAHIYAKQSLKILRELEKDFNRRFVLHKENV